MLFGIGNATNAAHDFIWILTSIDRRQELKMRFTACTRNSVNWKANTLKAEYVHSSHVEIDLTIKVTDWNKGFMILREKGDSDT